MSKRFCPKCGVSIESGTFCEDCVEKEVLKLDVPLIQVSEFNRFFHKGLWHPFEDIEQLIIKRVKETVGKNIDVKILPFEFEPKPKQKIKVDVSLIIDGKERFIKVPLSYRQCDYGQKNKTQYFEGILQLRNPIDSVIDFIDKQMKLIAPKGVFITKTVEVKNGVDLYFTKKNPMRIIAQKIVNKFGGRLHENAQLFSHNHMTSKDLFRLNILLELPLFTKGDTISFKLKRVRGEDLPHIVQVTRMGKLTHGTDLLTGKQITFEFRFAIDIKKLKSYEAQVVAVNPELQILHPETYQTQVPVNSKLIKHNLKIDSKAKIVLSSKGILLTY